MTHPGQISCDRPHSDSVCFTTTVNNYLPSNLKFGFNDFVKHQEPIPKRIQGLDYVGRCITKTCLFI